MQGGKGGGAPRYLIRAAVMLYRLGNGKFVAGAAAEQS